MSLGKFLLMLKGGAGSGHHGHSGIPGKRGGSASSNLLSLGEEKSEGFTTDISKPSKGFSLAKKYAKALDEYQDKSGLELESYKIRSDKSKIVVYAKVLDKDGNKVGNIKRTFDFDNKEVHHDWMDLKDEYKGSGFASRFYSASERLYPSMGINKVTIEATMGQGGYSWARMGYDFANKADKARVRDKLASEYKQSYGSNLSSVPEKPWEIASFKGPDGRNIGKEVFLKDSTSNGWSAVKNLSPNDPGYKAGLEYYKQKGII